jgi:hypothetical protein
MGLRAETTPPMLWRHRDGAIGAAHRRTGARMLGNQPGWAAVAPLLVVAAIGLAIQARGTAPLATVKGWRAILLPLAVAVFVPGFALAVYIHRAMTVAVAAGSTAGVSGCSVGGDPCRLGHRHPAIRLLDPGPRRGDIISSPRPCATHDRSSWRYRGQGQGRSERLAAGARVRR